MNFYLLLTFVFICIYDVHKYCLMITSRSTVNKTNNFLIYPKDVTFVSTSSTQIKNGQ